MKAGVIAAFAVIFGIVQILCACMDMPSTQADVPAKALQHMSMEMSGQEHHAMTDPAQNSMSHDHGEHDHKVDCSHCDDTVVLAVSADISPNVFTTPASYKTAFYDRVPDTRADMAATNLSGLRWLDPPRRDVSLTPVTLHNRSQI